MHKPNPWVSRAVDFELERAAKKPDEPDADDQSPDGRSLYGYAAVFNTPTEINSWEGKFSEEIARGAFSKTLGERTPVLQFDHGHDARTGSVPIGKFNSLTEDKRGLKVDATLFDNPVVEPIRQAIEAGAVSGMSFRFQVVRDQWRDNSGKLLKPQEIGELLYNPGDRGPLKRTIREVKLMEAGPVVFPAYPETSVGVRSMTDADRQAIAEEYARTASCEEVEESGIMSDGDESREAETVDAEEGVEVEARDESTDTASPEDAAQEGTSSGNLGLSPEARNRKLFLMTIQK